MKLLPTEAKKYLESQPLLLLEKYYKHSIRWLRINLLSLAFLIILITIYEMLFGFDTGSSNSVLTSTLNWILIILEFTFLISFFPLTHYSYNLAKIIYDEKTAKLMFVLSLIGCCILSLFIFDIYMNIKASKLIKNSRVISD